MNESGESCFEWIEMAKSRAVVRKPMIKAQGSTSGVATTEQRLFSRRSLIHGGIAGCALMTWPALGRAASAPSPVFDTTSGKIRGSCPRGSEYFQGYSLCGSPQLEAIDSNRRRSKALAGIRNARLFGPQAMQGPGGQSSADAVREFKKWQATEDGRIGTRVCLFRLRCP